MKRFIILLSLLSGFYKTAHAQEIDFRSATISKELLNNANAVIRHQSEVFSVESIGKATEKVHIVVTVLNHDGEDEATVEISYDNKLETIKSLEGKLYDATGKLVSKLKKSDIKDESYSNSGTIFSDNRYKIAQFTYAQYPYTVEFEYEVEHNGLLFYPVFRPQSGEKVTVENASLEVQLPKTLKLRYKELNIKDKVAVTSLADKQSYKWSVKNILIAAREKLSSPWYENTPIVYTAPTDFEIEGYKGNMNSWESFGKFIAQLNAGRDDLPESTKQKVKELVANTPSKAEKVRKLYEYMQSKTHYVLIALGIGGWQPLPASFVDEKGYGDCKALSNYMYSLLKAAGINSHYTLVYAGKRKQPVYTDFSCAYFNHAILCVPVEKDTMWLECTSQTEPTGYSGEFTTDRSVLLVTPTGGKIANTKKYSQKENLLNRKAEVQIAENGDATVKVKTIYSCFQQDDLAPLIQKSKEDQKKALNEAINLGQFTLHDFSLSYKKDRLPVITENLELSITHFGAKNGKRIFITPNLMNKYESNLPENEDRKSDIYLSNYEYLDVDTIRYHIPENYHLEGTFNDIQLKSVFGEYSVKVKIEQGLVTYIRTFSRKSGKYPKEKYKELVDFLKNVSKADKTKIVFVSNT
jgi:transglutaminase-like putative cysteine protease